MIRIFVGSDKEMKKLKKQHNLITDQFHQDNDMKTYIRETDKVLKEMDKLINRQQYKASGNKMNFFMWFVWWCNGTGYIIDGYQDINRGDFKGACCYGALLVMAICLLVSTYKMIVRNKKAREDLFIEGI